MDKNREVNSSYSLRYVQTAAKISNIVDSNNVESWCEVYEIIALMKPWFFFRLLLSNCLNWKIYCDDRSSFSMLRVVAFVLAVVCRRMQQLPALLAPTMLRVVEFVLTVVCKRIQQLSTLLAPTMLRVVAFVLAVVCKRMQQLPALLAPTMLRVVEFVLTVVCKRIQQLSTLLAPTMLRVVAFVLAVVCKRMQQLPTLFAPTMLRVVEYVLAVVCKHHCCCVRVGSGVQKDATTPSNVGTWTASWEGYNP